MGLFTYWVRLQGCRGGGISLEPDDGLHAILEQDPEQTRDSAMGRVGLLSEAKKELG